MTKLTDEVMAREWLVKMGLSTTTAPTYAAFCAFVRETDRYREAIKPTPAAPKGFVLVPEKVTNAMIDAANGTPLGIAGTPPHWQFVWDAMLAASLAAPAHIDIVGPA